MKAQIRTSASQGDPMRGGATLRISTSSFTALVFAAGLATQMGCSSATENGAEEAVVSTAAADTYSRNVGYAVMDADLSIDPSQSWSSEAGTTFATNPSTGYYLIHFPGITNVYGNVQLTTANTNYRCTLGGWGQKGGGLQVGVYCTTPAGTPANLAGWGELHVLYLTYANGNPTIDVPVIDYFLTANLAGGPASGYSGGTFPASVEHVSPGVYDVTVQQWSQPSGIHVTAVNSTGGYCKVAAVLGGGSSEVYCFNASGYAADSQFSYSVITGADIAGLLGGSALILTGSATPYVDVPIDWSPHASAITATYESTGTNVFFGRGVPEDAISTSIGLVTAYGTNSNYCNGDGYGEAFGDATEAAYCFTHNGTYVPGASQGASFFISLTAR